MKRTHLFSLITCLMLIVAAAFVWFACNHPECSFPWPVELTRILYCGYLVVMLGCFTAAVVTAVIDQNKK